MGDFISKSPIALSCYGSDDPDAQGPSNPLRQTDPPTGSLVPPLSEQGHTEGEVPRTVMLNENLRRFSTVGAPYPRLKAGDLFLEPDPG